MRKPEGASTLNNQSANCQAVNKQDTYLGKADWNTMLEAKSGNVSIETGTYGRYLTITDGKSVNSTWTGKWGEEGEADTQPGNATVSSRPTASTAVSFQPIASSSTASALKAEMNDFNATILQSSNVTVPMPSTDTRTLAPTSTQDSSTALQTPSLSTSTTGIGYAAASDKVGSSVRQTPTEPASCAANVARKGHSRQNFRRAHQRML